MYLSLKWCLKIPDLLIWDIHKLQEHFVIMINCERWHIYLNLNDMVSPSSPVLCSQIKISLLYTVFPIKAFSKDIIFHLDCKDMDERAGSFIECGKFCYRPTRKTIKEKYVNFQVMQTTQTFILSAGDEVSARSCRFEHAVPDRF
jgi:hypothetical protein